MILIIEVFWVLKECLNIDVQCVIYEGGVIDQ